MEDEGFKRKLTAILSADVEGYSRLMEDNEEETIQTLNAYRNSISTLISQHRGRLVDMTGDNLMAEFSSVVDAVKCAVETQKEMGKRNADLPENRRMLFRIGVNLGDIVEEGDRIYGDGVNILSQNYLRIGDMDKARWHAQEGLRQNPEYTFKWEREGSMYKDPALIEQQIDDLRKAGLTCEGE